MKKSIMDIDIKGKRVLVRVDFNVPMLEKTGQITDDTRIKASLPTIDYLLKNNAIILLGSHLGRPDGKWISELSLKPIASRLAEIIGKNVMMAPDCIGAEVERLVSELKPGDVMMLENLRFHPEEEKNDPSFALKLSKLCDIFVNDAFGTAHRAHASTVGICKYVPSVAGFLLEKELLELGKLIDSPQHPFCCLAGGAKVSDKIGLLFNLINKIDYLLIGGGMAATFLAAQRIEVGKSKVEINNMGTALHIIEDAKKRGAEVLLPLDVVISDSIVNPVGSQVVAYNQIPSDYAIVDVGPKTVGRFSEYINKSKTILWNGPMGIYEISEFASGTEALAKAISIVNAVTVIGGGSTAEIVEKMGLTTKMTHVSTGGGASLSFLEGVELPGVTALMEK